MSYLFHGSHIKGITSLKPCSVLHGSDKKVVWLTEKVPYALIYIWDGEHNNLRREKHVTAWVKEGMTYYEEQFPDQLETFYKGVSGYLYHIPHMPDIKAYENREGMYYCADEVTVERVSFVSDVYDELLRYEQKGDFTVRRFCEQTAERQRELTELMATAILRDNFCEGNEDKAGFYKMYFEKSWEIAKELRKKGYDK